MPAEDLSAVVAISAAERRAEWARIFGKPAPPAFGTGLLGRALAYRLQEKKFGGLTVSEKRRLIQIGRKEKRERARGTITTTVKPETWLSRTWHGEVHQVIVLETGFDYLGQRYASLTAIAKMITGANWSGPRFFGLHSPRLARMEVTADG